MRSFTLFVGDENGLRDVHQSSVRSKRPKLSVTDNEFGYQTKMRRVALQLNQVEFAKHMGMHQVTLSRIESGATDVTPSARERIESAFRLLEDQ